MQKRVHKTVSMMGSLSMLRSGLVLVLRSAQVKAIVLGRVWGKAKALTATQRAMMWPKGPALAMWSVQKSVLGIHMSMKCIVTCMHMCANVCNNACMRMCTWRGCGCGRSCRR